MREPERAHAIALKAVYQHYALQKVHELAFLLALTDKDDIVVEIGCDAGGTSWAIKEMGVGLHIGIDLPGENYSSGLAWMGDNSAHMIWGDSHLKETRTRLDEMLDGAQIDILIIDGDHTYPGVADDFRMYSKLVSGLVIFHDICEHQQQDVQVDKFYAEVSKRYPHTEYIDINDQSWGGIGVLDLSYSNRLHNACS